MTKKYKRAAASIVLVLCMLLTLCSCTKKDKSRTLTFASWYTKEDTLAYRDIAAKYNELYPEVTVKFVTLEKPDNDFSVYTENAIKAIDEDNVDLVLLHPSAMALIYERGWIGSSLADVSQSPLFQQYSNAIQQLVTGTDGTAYGCPFFMSFSGLLVNTDLLKACGVNEPPAAYSEWVNSMELVKQAGYIPFASYDGSDSSSMFLITAMAQAEILYGKIPPDADAYDIFSPSIKEFFRLMDTGLLELSGAALVGGTERDVVEKAFPQGNVSPLKNNTTSDEFYGTVLSTIQSGSTYSDSINQYGFDIVNTFNDIAQQLHSGMPLDSVLKDFNAKLRHTD